MEAPVARNREDNPENKIPDARIAEAIKVALTDEKLPCAAAFAITQDMQVTPQAVGEAADLMDIRLSRCQLGFFGYPDKQGYSETNIATLDVPDGLQEAIRAARNDIGDVTCAALWILADTYKAPRMLVGYVTDQLGIHVTPCQLGAF